MLNNQIKLNEQVSGPEWVTDGSNWYTAIWTECAELMETTDWKWWKQTGLKMSEFQLELVDILHFGLASLLIEGYEAQGVLDSSAVDKIARYMDGKYTVASFTYVGSEIGMHRSIEQIAFSALSTKKFDVVSFFQVALASGLSLDDLFRIYLTKSTLNNFRQCNGYASGTYTKNWNGVDDSIVALHTALHVPSYTTNSEKIINVDHFQIKLFNMLMDKYAEAIHGN
jgi:hypothetical protein